ncbi:DUF4157 domain-containing protein [Microbacterium sp. EYE_512]|uniref:DUF4157 domain-containing protein n=2 Tax=Microbacteriaceae TaxID=85023 RepID=A0ABX5SWX1_9MICO|nr:DUF4157 domain-containing protein [Microbacterium sp. EYE_512]QBR90708.1 DUF4157 domain-containing protein [Microbacterium wangchenii]TXK11148.1 DUF4157 domain-containing protein [Microbacterium wangchenii]
MNERQPFGRSSRDLPVLDAAGVLRLQREVGNAATSSVIEEERSPVLDAISSGGETLQGAVRADMESRMGADFGDVRVHTDTDASESARSVGARAYTVGPHLVFQRDAYDPGSPEGRTTLAHELTHVMQQREGPVEGTPAEGGINVSSPDDRFERDAVENAARVLSGPAVAEPQVQRDSCCAEPVAQREDDPGEEPEELSAEEPVQTLLQ